MLVGAVTSQSLNHIISGDSTRHQINSAYEDLCTLKHTHTHAQACDEFTYITSVCFLMAKILNIRSFIQGLLNENKQYRGVDLNFEEQRNTTFTQREHKNKRKKNIIQVTNVEIWRGCCNQSLESSAFRRGCPHLAKLDVKLSLN